MRVVLITRCCLVKCTHTYYNILLVHETWGVAGLDTIMCVVVVHHHSRQVIGVQQAVEVLVSMMMM
jgi:hypothetical protein